MAPAGTERRSGGNHVESLLFLKRLLCCTYGDTVLIQRKNGQIVFWCGCVRDRGTSEMQETDLNCEVVKVKR